MHWLPCSTEFFVSPDASSDTSKPKVSIVYGGILHFDLIKAH